MTINFEATELPTVDWLGLRMGNIDPNEVSNDLKQYDLTVDDIKTMYDVDLDCHLSKYGINYLVEKAEFEAHQEMENRLYNGGLTDDELMNRFNNAMYGHGCSNQNSFDMEY